jgi:hypothetical protein
MLNLSLSLFSTKMNIAWKHFKKRANEQCMELEQWSEIILGLSWQPIASKSQPLQIIYFMAAQALITSLNFGKDAGFQRLAVEFTDLQLHAMLKSNDTCLTELNDVFVQISGFSRAFL